MNENVFKMVAIGRENRQNHSKSPKIVQLTNSYSL